MTAKHPRRRSTKAVARIVHGKPKLSTSLRRAATSKPAKAAYVVLGTVGLAALAVAILGPKRLEREVLKPLQKAVGPQAEKLWDQARPVREQMTSLFRRAGSEREKLARDFQSWIGHFRAS
jgi:NAD/NADP transhydrogenase alpha subunit